jgi:hypothetical protein
VNSPTPIIILETKTTERATNAGVRQDKETPRRYRAASAEPSNAQDVAFQHKTDENTPAFQNHPEATPAWQRPKHHGSQKRRVVPVSGCVPPFIADQLERMRDQGGKQKLSRSAVVADLILRGVQQKVDMQYGATLEPVIEKSIDRNIQSYSNRNANINLQTYYAAEQARILSIHILRFLTDLVDSPDELVPIIKASQEEAWKNMTNLHRDKADNPVQSNKTATPAREEDNAQWPS